MADEVLKKLQELASVPELTSGFNTQQECIAWANKVLPALVFSIEFRQEFMAYQQNINIVGLSGDLQASSLNQMVSILGLAIADRQHQLAQQPQLVSDELLEYVDIFKNILGRFKIGTTWVLTVDDEAYFKQRVLEVISLINEFLGEKNQYSLNIILAVNDTGGNGPSKFCVQTVKGIVLAAQKEIKRKESQVNGGDVFNHLLTDSVTIIKRNGEKHHNIKAVVKKDVIHIPYESVSIEKGDKIQLTQVNRPTQVFVVVDPGFQPKIFNMPAYFKIKYCDEADVPNTQPLQVFHFNGDNSRVNINSTDSSTNVVNTNSAELFDGLLKLIKEQIEDAKDRESLFATIEAMRQAQGTSGFTSCYQEFMAVASDHITVFGPFIPALTKLLSFQ